MSLHLVDYSILLLYFVFVLGIGWFLRKSVASSSDFLTSSHSLPLWITSLAFLAANMGALEMIGMCGSGAKYGMMTSHFYWVGAIPAMLFLGVVMMPFYYISKTHSVPGYLKLRFDERSRALSAITFGLMTVLMSGINMYSMALVMKVVLGWDIHFSIWVSSLTVAAYVFLGGLLSAIFNEVLQFVLIWLGAMLVPIVGLIETGGWSGMVERITRNFPGQNYTSLWSTLGSAADNPMGIHWTGIVLGLGWVISFGYWTTDFLVVQRVMTAKDLRSAKMAPIIGAAFKMMVPFIVILPGLLGLAVLPFALTGEAEALASGGHSYNEVLPLMLARYLGPGLLGLGVTALIAGFMSGMAGNVTAFNTVWTYDIYQSYIRKHAPDSHYLWMGRMATIFGTSLSIGAAYLARSFNNMMDFLQLIFGFVNAPLFATFLLGMFWKRATANGAFSGLVSGTAAAALTYGLTRSEGKGGWLAVLYEFPSSMAQNFWVAINAFCVCFAVTVLVSLAGRARPEKELVGLVYGVTPHAAEPAVWYKRPAVLASLAAGVCVILNVIFF